MLCAWCLVCQDLVSCYFYFVLLPLGLEFVASVMLYPCILCVALLMFGCGYYFVVDRVWSSKGCLCCACDPSMHLNGPSISFANVFVCRKLSPHLNVLELDHSLCCFLV